MKKMLPFFLFFLCFFPFSVKAESYGVERFYINVSVNEKGDLDVEEFIQLNGSYNGFERIIHPKQYGLRDFTGIDEDFGGSSIYNGNEMKLLEVRGITFENVPFSSDLDPTFEQIRKNSSLYKQVYYANKGDSGVYELNGDSIRIYNPDKKTGFYLKYTITDMAILHEDVAEFGWNIFSTEMRESINDFKVLLHFPNNKEELRAFAHGPLTGNITLLDKTKVLLDVKGLPAYQPLDTRIVFDKSIIPFASKTSNVTALDKILKYEGKMADDANQQREAARETIKRRKVLSYIILFISILWGIGAAILAFLYYRKFDKEYIPAFKGKYFRDFPSDLNPEIVGYLINKKITTNDLSASILNLIYKKKIGYEKVDKDYKLTLLENDASLTEAEEKAVVLLFDEKTETSMKKFKSEASSGYEHFLTLYNNWLLAATKEALTKDFFIKPGFIKTCAIVYSVVGFIFLAFTLRLTMFPIFHMIFLFLDFMFLFYIGAAKKRTVTGNEEYHKWLGLKNFMNDFGNFEKRELPQIELWEKYMVYAVTFGVAKKLSEQMKVKINEYDLDGSSVTFGNTDYFTDMLFFNHVISSDIVSAHSSAISAQSIANSSDSSGGGFGGGFSSGGGSFGGGGGGGRF